MMIGEVIKSAILAESDMYATLTQAYAELYLPVLGGSNLMVGLFHTPLINEIGFALPCTRTDYLYTHPYSFIHGPPNM